MNPLPNHCIECDTPTMDTLCNKCKEKDMTDHLDKAMQELQLHAEEMICNGCGEISPICYCDMAPEEDEMSNCCSAPFTYPGWPDSDICNDCGEHADIWEKEDE